MLAPALCTCEAKVCVVLKGVRGMRVGGQRKLLVPPNLAYGDKGMREIPPGKVESCRSLLLSWCLTPRWLPEMKAEVQPCTGRRWNLTWHS